jgi:hypothetical protein
MKIKEDGFLYKTAFGLDERPPKEKVSICILFWKFVFMFIVGWPLHILLSWPLALLAGKHPVSYGRGCDNNPKINYIAFERWPAIGKFKFYPIYFLLASGLFSAFYFYLKISLITMGIIVAILLLIIGKVLYDETETGEMIAEYLKATKEKICPFVFIE